MGTYTGTPLSNAQRRVAELQANSHCEPDDDDCLFARFGSTNIPDQVVQWMNGNGAFSAATANASFDCHGDAMSHFNKGVVGLRLEFVKGVILENVTISDLHNKGVVSPHHPFCGPESDLQYRGSDVRGVSVGGGTKLSQSNGIPEGVTINLKGFSSESGQVDAFVDEGMNVDAA